MGNQKLGFIDYWLEHLRHVRARHAEELGQLEEEDDRINLLSKYKYVACPV
jgi:carbonic anhydrase